MSFLHVHTIAIIFCTGQSSVADEFSITGPGDGQYAHARRRIFHHREHPFRGKFIWAHHQKAGPGSWSVVSNTIYRVHLDSVYVIAYNMHMYVCIYLFIYLSIRLSIYPSIYLSTYIYICISMCMCITYIYTNTHVVCTYYTIFVLYIQNHTLCFTYFHPLAMKSVPPGVKFRNLLKRFSSSTAAQAPHGPSCKQQF